MFGICFTKSILMKKEILDKKSKEKNLIQPRIKHKKFLEKLGFVQMVFDFYTSPIV